MVLYTRVRQVIKKYLTIKYKDIKFEVKLRVESTFENLTQHGWQREGGLLTFYGSYAVVGCGLYGFDYEPYARKLLGDVEIMGDFKSLLNQEPEILDFRRRGFNENHEFYDKFLQPLVQNELKKLIDKEIENARIAGETFSGKNIYDVMMQINKIAKDLLEGEPRAPAQFPIDFISFYFRGQKKIEVKEGEWQALSLAVNKKTVPNGSVIRIRSDNPKIYATPAEIKVKHQDSMLPDRINYRVYLLAQKPGIIGKVDATVLQDKKTEIDVISNPNAKMHPKNGFAFYPERETIPLNQTDKVSLIVD